MILKLKKAISCLWICILFVALFYTAQVFGLIVGLVQFLAQKASNSMPLGLPVSEKVTFALSKNTSNMLFAMEAVTAIFIFIFAVFIYKGKFKKLFKLKHPIRIILYICIAATVYIAVSYLLTTIPWPKAWIQANSKSTGLALHNDGSWFMMWISTGFFAPLSEELVFRGMIVSIVRKKSNKWIAIILSSVAFGLVHGNILQGMYTCIFGIVFCILNDQEHSVTPGIAAHMTINTISTLIAM